MIAKQIHTVYGK